MLVLSWNCTSFKTHKADINHAIQVYQPDVILLQETRIKQTNQLPNYNQYRAYANFENRKIPGKRGLLFLIKQEIQHSVINIEHVIPDYIDILGVSITDSRGRCFDLYNIYMLQGATFEYGAIFQNKDTIIMGDFNSRHRIWGFKTNKSGRSLAKLVLDNDYVVLNDRSPTTRFNTAIDLTIAHRALANKVSWQTFDLWAQDHFGQVAIIHDTRMGQPYIEEEVWRIEKADWATYSEILDQKVEHTLLPSFVPSIEEYVKFLCDSITEAAECTVPKTKTKRNKKRRWRLTEEAKLWHHQISRATKAFKNNPSEATLRELRELQRDASVSIKESRNVACGYNHSTI